MPVGLEIARDVLVRKVTGREHALETVAGSEDAREIIGWAARAIENARTVDACREAEAQAARAYSPHPVDSATVATSPQGSSEPVANPPSRELTLPLPPESADVGAGPEPSDTSPPQAEEFATGDPDASLSDATTQPQRSESSAARPPAAPSDRQAEAGDAATAEPPPGSDDEPSQAGGVVQSIADGAVEALDDLVSSLPLPEPIVEVAESAVDAVGATVDTVGATVDGVGDAVEEVVSSTSGAQP